MSEEVKCIRPGVGGQSQRLIHWKMIKCQCPKHKHITVEYAKEVWGWDFKEVKKT